MTSGTQIPGCLRIIGVYGARTSGSAPWLMRWIMNSSQDGSGISRFTVAARISVVLLAIANGALVAFILCIFILKLLGWQDLDSVLNGIMLLTILTMTLLIIAEAIYVGLHDAKTPKI